MDKQQREKFDQWNQACATLRAWIVAHPGQSEVPVELVDALDQAERAYQATRQPTPAPIKQEIRRA